MTARDRQPPALHDQLLDVLGAEIATGVRVPGDRILATEVGERLDASRSTVREAIRVLESMGMVRSRRNVGAVVQPPNAWNPYAPQLIKWRLAGPGRLAVLHSLSELRCAVEPLAASLAAQRASAEHCATLVTAAKGMGAAAHDADGDAYLECDVTFHNTLMEASGNPFLSALRGVVEQVLRGRTRHALMPHVADPQAVHLHQVAAARITEGDTAGAADAMTAIINEADTATQHP